MEIVESLRIIKDVGLVAEKMTDEEKAAKRKARRDARKAEEKAYKDAHWQFELNIRGGGAYDMLYKLQHYVEYEVPGNVKLYRDSEDEQIGFKWEKEDNVGKLHQGSFYFNASTLKNKEIIAEVYLDGEKENTYSYNDSEAESSWFSSRTSNLKWEWRKIGADRYSSFDFIVTINKKDFIEFCKMVAKKAIENLDRRVAMVNAETENSADRVIPEFKYMEFSFSDNPIDDMSGKESPYRVPYDKAMDFFRENCGDETEKYSDFKEFFDSLDISYMRSMHDDGSLMRSAFNFSQYKWFKKGGELKGRLWFFPAFKGWENDDVKLKGWKLV